jgi:hypothetical protein
MPYTPAAVQLEGQHPLEVLDHALDFAAQIPTGDSLSSIVAFHVAAGLTLTPSGTAAPAISGTAVAFWLGGGTSGTTYAGEVRVATANGRTLVANFQIAITDPAPGVPAS